MCDHHDALPARAAAPVLPEGPALTSTLASARATRRTTIAGGGLLVAGALGSGTAMAGVRGETRPAISRPAPADMRAVRRVSGAAGSARAGRWAPWWSHMPRSTADLAGGHPTVIQ